MEEKLNNQVDENAIEEKSEEELNNQTDENISGEKSEEVLETQEPVNEETVDNTETSETETMDRIEVTPLSVGDHVTGQVSKVEDKQVLVQIPESKLDGIIPISELSSLHIEKAEDAVNVGDELNLEIIKVEEDALILSKRRVDAEKAWSELQAKFDNNEPVTAEIKDIVKGGLVVDLGVRGFVPASLLEDYFVEDFSDYKGKEMDFKIVEIDPEKNRLILSHRDIVLEEKEKKRKEVLDNIEAGKVLKGTVQRVTNFGAFVDIGGVDGLVHISQLAHHHVDHPSDVVEAGEEVNVKVLSVDRDSERISLSIKETLPGPWDDISSKVSKGEVLEGTVKRLVSFGAFVEVLPGVEGLVHISQISNKHINNPHEVLKEGEQVKVKVLDVNEPEKRISLSMKELEEPAEEESIQLPEQSRGFQLGEVIGDQLKNFNE